MIQFMQLLFNYICITRGRIERPEAFLVEGMTLLNAKNKPGKINVKLQWLQVKWTARTTELELGVKYLCLVNGETEGGRRSCPWIALRNGLSYGRDLLSTWRSPTVRCGFKNLCVGYGVDGRMTSLGCPRKWTPPEVYCYQGKPGLLLCFLFLLWERSSSEENASTSLCLCIFNFHLFFWVRQFLNAVTNTVSLSCWLVPVFLGLYSGGTSQGGGTGTVELLASWSWEALRM